MADGPSADPREGPGRAAHVNTGGETVPHQQIKSTTAASPPDIEHFFAVLAEGDPNAPDVRDRPINVCSVGGSALEHHGEIFVGVGSIEMSEPEEEEILEIARDRLRDRGFDADIVGEEDIRHGFIKDEPGALLAFLSGIADENIAQGRLIHTISIGGSRPASGGRTETLVQVYCPQHKTAESRAGWRDSP